jgi:hypothetical protein
MSRLRKSISCMSAGLLIAVPMWMVIYAEDTGWIAGHWILPVAVVSSAVIGVIWLYDELIG